MDFQVGYSFSEDMDMAVADSTKDMDEATVIIYFAPISVFEAFTYKLKERFPDALLCGASCCMSLFSGREALKVGRAPGIAVAAFGEGYECHAGVLEEASQRPVRYIDNVSRCMKQFDSLDNVICVSFTNCFRSSEEIVLDTLNEALKGKGINVVGCSCGTDSFDHGSLVALNGRIFEDTALFMLIRGINRKIRYVRQNLFKPMRKSFIATSVDVKSRTVYEFDGIPAVDALARSFRIPEADVIGNPTQFLLGRKQGDNINVTEVVAVTEEHGVMLSCAAFGGTKLFALEADDNEENLSRLADKIHEENANPRFVLFLGCISAINRYYNQGWLPAFCAELGEITKKFIGISGFGEQIGYSCMSDTLLAVVFE